MEYKALLESLGIQTRLGKCSLSVAYEHINEQRAQSYEEEFAALAGFEQSPMLKWIKTMHSKNTLSEAGMVIVEILTEMYKKLDKLERLLTHKEENLLPLACEGRLAFVGHNALCLGAGQSFGEIGSRIYARVFVPLFPERIVGIFAKVLHPQIAQIEHIHIKNRTYFDTFVAECERSMILDAKSLKE